MLNMLFLVLMCLSTGYSSILGGKDGRIASAAFALAWLLSFPYLPTVILGHYDRTWIDAQIALIDLLLVVCLAMIAARTGSFWPIWVLGFQVVAVAIDLLILSFDNSRPVLSYFLHAFWSIPQLVAMPFGIFLDRRQGLPDPRKTPAP